MFPPRTICRVIDQVRVFKEHMYGCEPHSELQDTLRHRILEFLEQDIPALAAQHDSNFHKLSSSSGGISGALRKIRGRLGSKSDK
jgi:hypothetical protein